MADISVNILLKEKLSKNQINILDKYFKSIGDFSSEEDKDCVWFFWVKLGIFITEETVEEAWSTTLVSLGDYYLPDYPDDLFEKINYKPAEIISISSSLGNKMEVINIVNLALNIMNITGGYLAFDGLINLHKCNINKLSENAKLFEIDGNNYKHHVVDKQFLINWLNSDCFPPSFLSIIPCPSSE